MKFILRFFFKRSFIFVLIFFNSCESDNKNIPTIGFLDLLQDETLAQAKNGFFDALKENGFSEDKHTLNVIYRNAQGDQPSLGQACDFMISKNVTLIATNPTLATITAVQKTKEIPVFMMVSPRPDLAGITGKNGLAPKNLFGVYETLDYIDTAMMLIKKIFPTVKKLGAIYNQAEPQSVDALNEIKKACSAGGIELTVLPVNSSSETQLVVQSLLSKSIEAFFALPDNVVFASMETIVKSCDDANVPVFTSEEGLVKRGALAAFGADMYQWGFQSGKQAAIFLKQKSVAGIKPEIVNVRRRVFNAAKAKQFNVSFDSTFTQVKK
jgi:putative ABC transport system substrate-binding protein